MTDDTLPAFTALDAHAADLESDPIGPESVVSGSPTAAAVGLGSFAGMRVGVWEITAGVVRDVEIDEMFVVISGAAHVTLTDDAGRRTVDLHPGVVCRLEAGMHTEWRVAERLRKVYILPA